MDRRLAQRTAKSEDDGAARSWLSKNNQVVITKSERFKDFFALFKMFEIGKSGVHFGDEFQHLGRFLSELDQSQFANTGQRVLIQKTQRVEKVAIVHSKNRKRAKFVKSTNVWESGLNLGLSTSNYENTQIFNFWRNILTDKIPFPLRFCSDCETA